VRGADERWFASYTRVSNLAYRTPQPWETYQYDSVGIGRGFSDYDEARLGVDLTLVPRTPVRLYGAYRRQGEGDYRLRYPAREDYATTPSILAGVVSRIARVGVAAAARVWRAEIGGDLGINHVQNADHVESRTRTFFAGRVRVALEPGAFTFLR
jgi:hypothetical protein